MKMKETVKFSIRGNPLDHTGDPIPYLNPLQRIFCFRKAKMYRRWQDYIRHAFYKNCPTYLKYEGLELFVDLPPLTTKDNLRAEMQLRIYWKNGIPGNTFQIFKGLAKTFFADDSYLEGSIVSHRSFDTRGRIEVEITHEME